jgi:hypothetical protein
MAVPQTNIDALWNTVVNPRLGVAPYTFGCAFDPNNPQIGTDCSGAAGTALSALVYGPSGIDWNRAATTAAFRHSRSPVPNRDRPDRSAVHLSQLIWSASLNRQMPHRITQ